jgi:hypothetical protein
VSSTTTLTDQQRRRLGELYVEAVEELRRQWDLPEAVPDFDVGLTHDGLLLWRSEEARLEGEPPLSNNVLPPELIGDDWAEEFRQLMADVRGATEPERPRPHPSGADVLKLLFRSIADDDGTFLAPTDDYARDDGGVDVERLTQDGAAAARGDRAASQRLRVAAMNAERARDRLPRSMPPTSLRRLGVRRRVGVERRPRRRASSLTRARARAPDGSDPPPPEPDLELPVAEAAA